MGDADKSTSHTVTPSRRAKPLIYRYHDYRLFITDWMQYEKSKNNKFSLRQFAKVAQLSPAYLSMILNEERPLTAASVDKLIEVMGLAKPEVKYFKLLHVLGDSDIQLERLLAYKEMLRIRAYRKLNNKEVEVYKYLSQWWHVALREMAIIPQQTFDAKVLRKRLRGAVPLIEIKRSLKFLISNGYLVQQPDGRMSAGSGDRLQCVGGVYKLSLAHFHSQMLDLAKKSIDTVPSEERIIYGHTMAIPKAKWPEFRRVLLEAVERIAAMNNTPELTDEVYYFGFYGIPLTGTEKEVVDDGPK